VTCNREAPSVEDAAARWAGRAQFVGVAWAGDDAEFAEFIDRHALTFPQISDPAGEIYDRFEVPIQPALAVVDVDGEVTTFFGAIDGEQIDAALTAASG